MLYICSRKSGTGAPDKPEDNKCSPKMIKYQKMIKKIKFTSGRLDAEKRNKLTPISIKQFADRIAADDSRHTVGLFRYDMAGRSPESYCHYVHIDRLSRIYPAAEFTVDRNGNVEMSRFNGLLLLTFYNADATAADLENAKSRVAAMPMTFAAFDGIDGKSIHVLVRMTDENGVIPDDEAEANRLYAIAYKSGEAMYGSVVGWPLITLEQPSVRDSFLRPVDARPFFNEDSLPLVVNPYPVSSISMTGTGSGHRSAYNDVEPNRITEMIDFLEDRYEFRYNEVMRCTEFRARNDEYGTFRAVDKTDINELAVQVGENGLEATHHDVKIYVHAKRHVRYNPVREYLYCHCYGKWDGKDHIGALARTVPNSNPSWERWFRIWFLGMVYQWLKGGQAVAGNSEAPLLIGPQGWNKSRFCRSLLPDELGRWGYTDNMLLSNKIEVHRMMSQMLLINLDEFNMISAKVQQGFLKNIMQLKTLKVRPPYGSRVEDFPRTASFIGTTNMTDVLNDPSGCRRFIAVELTAPIDMSVRPNHVQLFAQAMDALRHGQKYYFDEEETDLLIRSNRRFIEQTTAEQLFYELFTVAGSEGEGEWMTAGAILLHIRSKAGALVSDTNARTFGRTLTHAPGMIHKKSNHGELYRVVRN